ncbi:hypothetical protein CDN99_15305 [Roseateles aquatilis]|uniref:Small-conductance mechanosensitive channel n=1 Tax=Roseateles aquatilis TaxID=431061 RepID=A0A246J8H6_9BURK|nr:mechanosensitive ion channel family protein [Burkholderiaceae bacterium]OWQ88840.1 hypothetical protein CDN99_15305 [Roseateles aquatilis]
MSARPSDELHEQLCLQLHRPGIPVRRRAAWRVVLRVGVSGRAPHSWGNAPRRASLVGREQFVSALAQVLAYLVAFVLYAHLVPELRALGTALLAGVSVVSVVVGLAAQNTLGNLIAGFSLVLYRQVRVGDTVSLDSPKGMVTARVELISLGFTVLRDEQQQEVIVPNSVLMNSTILRVARSSD